MAATFLPHGTNGLHVEADEQIDTLYAWWPGAQPQAPAPCPEATFSATLKGTIDGHETLLTVRGQSAAEFQRNLAAIRGLLDAPAPGERGSQPAPRQGSQDGGWCAIHNTAMKLNEKDGRQWYSHYVDEERRWCKGRSKGA
jgi:hypothetical protein